MPQAFATFAEAIQDVTSSPERARAFAPPLPAPTVRTQEDGTRFVTYTCDRFTLVLKRETAREGRHWRYSWTWTDTAAR
jgi:hypothetical protein